MRPTLAIATLLTLLAGCVSPPASLEGAKAEAGISEPFEVTRER